MRDTSSLPCLRFSKHTRPTAPRTIYQAIRNPTEKAWLSVPAPTCRLRAASARDFEQRFNVTVVYIATEADYARAVANARR
jgi:hypothetical protein